MWGGELRPGDRSVDVYVSKLRGKLEAALPDRRFIHTHQGFGYRFQPEPSRGHAARHRAAAHPSGLGRDVRFHEMFTSVSTLTDSADAAVHACGP